MSGRFGILALDARTFRKGDRVRLRHTGLQGVLVELEGPDRMRVQWDPGESTWAGRTTSVPRAGIEVVKPESEADRKFDDARRRAVRKAK